MSELLVEAYTSALKALEGRAPKSLLKRAELEAEDLGPDVDVSEARLRDYLTTTGPDDRLLVDLHLNLLKWDAADKDGNSWTQGTNANTDERRDIVLRALQVEVETAEILNERCPVVKGESTVVIGDEWEPWYTPEVQRKHDFYWRHYSEYLRIHKGWGPEALAELHSATSRVVERFAEPSRAAMTQTKGLVVGYVQSGKTANFTGVIAKAIDAGYRLIIVMTGTTNLLREQTQRRLDMELVGKENLLRGADENDPASAQDIDYLDDEDWIKGKFISHEVRPSEFGRPDIHRMTTRVRDYRKLQQGIPALEFERRDRTKPLWNEENLYTSDARVIVVKKNTSVLRNLVKDLKKTGDKLEDIPALIIDDESDQASVNTTDPKKWEAEQKDRTAINQHLSNLLKMLPRLQYVGYTATPFANVFVDPSDNGDIFPKDYLISLKRPLGYMGAEDFHDLDGTVPEAEKTFANSKEKAHVRLLEGEDEASEIRSALDSFVLAGAIKLYRMARGDHEFKHHTMLVHETMRTAVQKTRADSIKELWNSAGYLTGSGQGRLKSLFETDFQPVSGALGLGYDMPANYDEIAAYVPEAVRKIARNGNPVLVVNSDKDIEQEELDFDKRPVWRVLVGGNKLARGFTVEGITVTYYSRNVGHAEALMQMGRWFGFRPGYRDLVRLFITEDVRDSFEAACRDEEHFRAELRQYAEMVDGRPLVTPRDIPPLVIRHGLRPTAANKMYNARLVERRTQSKEPSSGYPKLTDQAALDNNIDACVPLLRAVAGNRKLISTGSKGRSFDALTGIVTPEQMVEVLERLQWATPDTFAPDLAWIRALPKEQLDSWLVVMPQADKHVANFRGVGDFSVHGRKVEPSHKIRGNSESVHRNAVRGLGETNPTRGCAIVYPVMKTERETPLENDGYPTGVVMAFALQLSKGALPVDHRPLVYQVVDHSKPLYAIVDNKES